MIDKAELYEYETNQKLSRMFTSYNPPKHPNLPLIEQKLLTDLYSVFRQYYLAHKNQMWMHVKGDKCFLDGFKECIYHGHFSSGMGYYRLQNDRIVALSLGGLFNKQLPSEIGQLTALRELYIQNQLISHIPWASSFPHLEIVFFDNCKLSQVPAFLEDCHNLKKVELKNNQITTLPSLSKIHLFAHCPGSHPHC